MKSKIWRGLAKAATKVNASQSDWWGHVGTMDIADLTLELMSNRMTWIPEDERFSRNTHLWTEADGRIGTMRAGSPKHSAVKSLVAAHEDSPI